MGGKAGRLVLLLAAALSLRLARAEGMAEEVADGLTKSIGFVSFGAPVAMTLLGGGPMHRAGRHAADAVIGAGAVAESIEGLFKEARPNNPLATDGFPSGHTALAFGLATGVGDQYHEWRLPMYVWAAAVGWSRHELGDHYWHQVMGGALIGFTVARISRDAHAGVCQGLFFDEDDARGFVGPTTRGEIALLSEDTLLWQWVREF
jgi:membrane-associated phospholipid phosphatase